MKQGKLGIGSMKKFFITFVICLLWLLNSITMSYAVFEGTANANMMIRRYERRNQFGKAGLWRETAAKCLEAISVPLAKITMEYCQQTGNMEIVRKMKEDIADAKGLREKHLLMASLYRQKAKESEEDLETERGKIDKFMTEWVHHYPDKFYEFGVYKNLFEERIDDLKGAGKYADALQVEAEASDMCARQYDAVTVRYFVEKGDSKLAELYRKVRDAHLRRSAMLRALASKNPENMPDEADRRDIDLPESKRNLTKEKALELAIAAAA